jgi:hypothetical protein
MTPRKQDHVGPGQTIPDLVNLMVFIVGNGSDFDSVWTNQGAAHARADELNNNEGEFLVYTVQPCRLNPPTAE